MKSIQLSIISICVLSLVGCAKSTHEAHSGLQIALSPVFGSAARATSTAFTEGDRVGLYLLRKVDNALFTVGADGVITSSPVLYYPDPKLPVAFRAYYPYNSSVVDATKIPFSVTTDLKQSDLCYAQAEALPSKEAQALPFKHWLSRVTVSITLNSKIKNITSVKFINTATDLTFNIETGAIALGVQNKSLVVNNSEAIVPPQTFAAGIKMLEITVETIAGATEIHYYAPLSALTLAQGKSHSFSLALNDDKSVTLNNKPQIAAWTAIAKNGDITNPVNNHISAHCAIANYRYSEINKIELSVKNEQTGKIENCLAKNVYLSSGSSIAAATYTFDLNSEPKLSYPYSIQSLKFYKNNELIETAPSIINNNIYSSGLHSIGVLQQASIIGIPTSVLTMSANGTGGSFVLKSNIPWELYNVSANLIFSLTASGAAITKGDAAPNGVTIYWRGVSKPCSTPKTEHAASFRGQAPLSNILANAVLEAVQLGTPSCKNPPTASLYGYASGLYWARGNLIQKNKYECIVGGINDYGLKFQYGSIVAWPDGNVPNGVTVLPSDYTGSFTFGDVGNKPYPNVLTPTVLDLTNGYGDPCRYYLGGQWRLPTTNEYSNFLSGSTTANFREDLQLFIPQNNQSFGFRPSGARNPWIAGEGNESGYWYPYQGIYGTTNRNGNYQGTFLFQIGGYNPVNLNGYATTKAVGIRCVANSI